MIDIENTNMNSNYSNISHQNESCQNVSMNSTDIIISSLDVSHHTKKENEIYKVSSSWDNIQIIATNPIKSTYHVLQILYGYFTNSNNSTIDQTIDQNV